MNTNPDAEIESTFRAENSERLAGQPPPTIEQVAWVFGALNESLDRGGCSFRRTIYGLMGFGSEAYMPLYQAGGMNITNALFDAAAEWVLSQKEAQKDDDK